MEIESLHNWNKILQAYFNETPIDAHVISKTNGGLSLQIDDVEAFMPKSMNALAKFQPEESLIGKDIKVNIHKINISNNGNIIVSNAEILKQKMVEDEKSLVVGEIYDGYVKSIVQYGMFVTIGDKIDGLVYISDISWGKVTDINELYQIGNQVKVKLTKIDEKGRHLSIKDLTENPWTRIDDICHIGDIINCKIVDYKAYGVIVEVVPGIEGLIHMSEFSWVDNKIDDIKSWFNGNDRIQAKIILLDKTQKKLNLSIKQIDGDPWDIVEEICPVGSSHIGKIKNAANFGIFITIDNKYTGVAFAQNFGYYKFDAPLKSLIKIGDDINVKVQSIDKKEKRMVLTSKDNIFNKVF